MAGKQIRGKAPQWETSRPEGNRWVGIVGSENKKASPERSRMGQRMVAATKWFCGGIRFGGAGQPLTFHQPDAAAVA